MVIYIAHVLFLKKKAQSFAACVKRKVSGFQWQISLLPASINVSESRVLTVSQIFGKDVFVLFS